MSRDRLRLLFLALVMFGFLFPQAVGAGTTPEDQITDFIKAIYPDEKTQVTFSSLPQQIKERVKVKNISFTKVPDASGDGICLVGIEGKNGAESSVYIPFKVLIERSFFLVKHGIRKGDVILPGDLTEKQTFLRGSAAAAPYPERLQDVVGKTAKKELSAGAIIMKQFLEDQVAISKGEMVNMTLQNQRILIQAKGTALEKGKMGDFIRLKSTSGREVTGKVTGSTSVSVEF